MPVATQAQVDAARAAVAALNAAIDDGIRQVTLPGGQVTIYNTTDSLIRARNDAQTRLAEAEASLAGAKRSKVTYLVYGGRG